ncbi:hypothetical protein TBLA_0G00690 [Henningerozyma blattae CBS 6284]|uniref:Golgi SNAP receptor complex member 1 n=1 Tax=Henningerozyma blattae (strain ATCC 34711 / CBS 6284 / DSM 70876 / NBRC 10599 / NRRL Y-10934 / UCD 77-7) TaxID=1071380 RepID=I2H6L4_HENB6|nr:hypothetical protein TBLA_0G00690 [Tetrapisispora blattae CBS 6284]CCH62016.1 hypothetical protein TBLA_0G00690 [Tetrapisispora blattae CBS 6284]
MSESGASFVTVRSKAIALETKAQGLLTKYSTFAQTTSSEASGEETKLSNQLEKSLQERQDIVELLQDICDKNTNISASKLSQLQRHKEVLQDHWKSFRNIRSSIQQERNRLNLLFSVKNDIAQQRQRDSELDTDQCIQNESRRIDESHNTVDHLISQAWETRDQFRAQSNILHSANNRMLQTLQRIPGINRLIGNIGTRRRKNALILASVLTLCFLFLFFTW